MLDLQTRYVAASVVADRQTDLVHLHGYYVFAHGPTILTNQVCYDTEGHFLKIFFIVYSITNYGYY